MGLIVHVLKKSGEPEMRTLVEDARPGHGGPIAGPFEPTPDRPAVLIGTGPMGRTVVFDAVPARADLKVLTGWVQERRRDHVGPMMNGRWIYTSDGRFPSVEPIAYFDRWETPQQYAAMWP